MKYSIAISMMYKRHIIRFSPKNSTIIYTYSFNNILLLSVNNIRDLGIVFSDTLSFQSHYITITNSALRTL